MQGFFLRKTYEDNFGWKHGRGPTIEEIRHANVAKVFFVSITKNPYFWLRSLHRRPYQHCGEFDRNFSVFIRTRWKCRDRDRIPHVENPVYLWNVKNRSYLEIPDDTRLNLRYEDYLADPDSFVRSIGTTTKLAARYSRPTIIEKSTKKDPLTLADYRKKYQERRIREKICPEDIAFINDSLDHELMKKFSYEIIGGKNS